MKSLTAQSGLLGKKWDIIKTDSSFHRVKLAQRDEGTAKFGHDNRHASKTSPGRVG
jgi:hypothetical protein